MKITKIIKDAFLFPSKSTGRFAVYLLLLMLAIGFALGGIFTYNLGLFDNVNYMLGGIYLIIAMLIGFILSGYHLKVIKSGIEMDDNVPVFELFDDFMAGFNNVLVSLFYFIIPALIVLLVGLDTNLYGNFITIIEELILQSLNVYMGNSTVIVSSAVSQAIVNWAISLATTITVALVLFAIFSILQSFAEARLANTGSVKEALNIFETVKDIARIGIGRVILFIILVVGISAIIEIIIITVFNSYPFLLFIFYIIVTPYLAIFTQRALGLLYSDIA